MNRLLRFRNPSLWLCVASLLGFALFQMVRGYHASREVQQLRDALSDLQQSPAVLAESRGNLAQSGKFGTAANPAGLVLMRQLEKDMGEDAARQLRAVYGLGWRHPLMKPAKDLIQSLNREQWIALLGTDPSFQFAFSKLWKSATGHQLLCVCLCGFCRAPGRFPKFRGGAGISGKVGSAASGPGSGRNGTDTTVPGAGSWCGGIVRSGLADALCSSGPAGLYCAAPRRNLGRRRFLPVRPMAGPAASRCVAGRGNRRAVRETGQVRSCGSRRLGGKDFGSGSESGSRWPSYPAVTLIGAELEWNHLFSHKRETPTSRTCNFRNGVMECRLHIYGALIP